MPDLSSRLERLGRPIPFVLVGAGSIGRGIFYQASVTPGFRCLGLADTQVEKALGTARDFGFDPLLVENPAGLEDAVRRGRLAVCADAGLLVECEAARVVIDASSALADAARFDTRAIRRGKHLVMMNAEADLLFGPHFLDEARRAGVVYTSCDGDQPAVIKRLVDEILFWRFELVMAGNIKGFLDRSADPTSILPEAAKRALDPKMCASYTDGTKVCVEQALVANALGLRTSVPGMAGPRAERLDDVFRLFDLPKLRRDHGGVVDYVLGPPPKGGVFVIGYNDQPFQKFMLGWFPSDLGPGPFYLFQRPYHLNHIESLRSVAEAALDGTAVLAPWRGFQTQVYAYAKRPLKAGEILDGGGGYACYGLIENCADQGDRPGLPVGLAESVALRRSVARGGKIYWDDVVIPAERDDFQTYASALRASRSLSGSVAGA